MGTNRTAGPTVTFGLEGFGIGPITCGKSFFYKWVEAEFVTARPPISDFSRRWQMAGVSRKGLEAVFKIMGDQPGCTALGNT
jgi:hypothetical protein